MEHCVNCGKWSADGTEKCPSCEAPLKSRQGSKPALPEEETPGADSPPVLPERPAAKDYLRNFPPKRESGFVGFCLRFAEIVFFIQSILIAICAPLYILCTAADHSGWMVLLAFLAAVVSFFVSVAMWAVFRNVTRLLEWRDW